MIQLNQPVIESQHTIITGCGRLGRSVAIALIQHGHTVHILDPLIESFAMLPQTEIDQGHIIPVIGDGTILQDLERAYIAEAKIFMALTGIDTQNILSVQIAKHLYKISKVICRIDDPSTKKIYNNLGIEALGSTTILTHRAVMAASA